MKTNLPCVPHRKSAASLLTALLFLCSLAVQVTAYAEVDPQRITAVASKAQTRAVRVIVGLDLKHDRAQLTFAPEGALKDPNAILDQRQAIGRLQQDVLTGLAGHDAKLIANFEFIAFMTLEVDGAALKALAALPQVRSIEEDIPQPPAMASSNPVIGSPTAWNAGLTGAGQAVAVLDTGVDCLHSFFGPDCGSRIASEACYSSTVTGQSTSVCPFGISGPGSLTGTHCPNNVSGCSHGTHVAGTAVGDDFLGPNFGVGRGADLIAIQVFSRFDSQADCGSSPAPCVLSYTTDQMLALQHVASLAATMPNHIASANMSIGGGAFTSPCDSDSRKAAVDSLKALNVATVIAAGNDSYINATGAPGCISTAVTVGATTDADAVAGFSNIAYFVDLLAPGVSINSSVPGGEFQPPPHTDIANFQGTSMAAPHVAGTWAVLRQKNPQYSVDEILGVLQGTGTLVDDQRGGGVQQDMPRINVDMALLAICPSDTYEPNNSPNEAGVSFFGGTQNICPSSDQDWTVFTRTEPFGISLQSTGPIKISLYDSSFALIESQDGLLDRTCGVDELGAGTYYVLAELQPGNGETNYTPSVTQGNCLAPVFNASDLGLRAAITNATPGATVIFAPSVFAGGETIGLTNGQILIDKDVTIDASALPGGVTIDASSNNARAFEIAGGSTVSMKGLTISNGQAGDGGAIQNNGNLTLTDSTLSFNSAVSQGGAIFNLFGDLTLRNVTLNGNSAGNSGGALLSNGGVFLMENTTVIGNNAVFYAGVANVNASATVIHSTITGNGNGSTFQGGGLSQLNYGQATLIIENNIIADNTATTGPDVFNFDGTFTPTAPNLIGNNATAETEIPAGALVGTAASPLDPLLGSLADNGGPTLTLLPQAGSPAIDAALTTANSPVTDQRGFFRPIGPANDLGAVENDVIAAPPNDGFADAIIVGNGSALQGTLLGATRDGSGSADNPAFPNEPDVWHRFAAAASGTLRVDTCGSLNFSDINTVLSVHADTGIAGTLANELGANDQWEDVGGDPTAACSGFYDSSLAVTVANGDAVLIRVSRGDDIGDLGFNLNVAFEAGVDSDGDGVVDSADNCTLVANSDQRDTNGDGFGNICDADLDNNGIVNAIDLGLFKSVFFTPGDLDADFNGDGIVNAIDLGIFKAGFFAPPGPSGVAF